MKKKIKTAKKAVKKVDKTKNVNLPPVVIHAKKSTPEVSIPKAF